MACFWPPENVWGLSFLIDVVVAGAGPAGNNVALRLASLGYEVTVLDWRTSIGDKLCTGIVGRECIRRFPLDRSHIYRDAQVATAVSPGGREVRVARNDVQAHIVDRVAYVASIGEEARRAGAQYLLGYRVTDVSITQNCATISYTDEREKRTLEARALVLASGFGSELAGQLGLDRVGDFVTGFQAEVLAPDVDEVNVYFGREVAPGFFGWLTPTSGGRALVGLLCRNGGQAYMDSLIQRLTQQGTVVEVTKSSARWGVPLRPLGRTFGDRFLVVGDAAGQAKPTTGGGIFYALMASEMAAEALHKALARGDLSSARLHAYEKSWKGTLSRELEIGYSARRFFEILGDSQIETLMQLITRNGIHRQLTNSRVLSFDWHSDAIVKLMGHPLLARALTLINPVLAALAPHR